MSSLGIQTVALRAKTLFSTFSFFACSTIIWASPTQLNFIANTLSDFESNAELISERLEGQRYGGSNRVDGSDAPLIQAYYENLYIDYIKRPLGKLNISGIAAELRNHVSLTRTQLNASVNRYATGDRTSLPFCMDRVLKNYEENLDSLALFSTSSLSLRGGSSSGRRMNRDVSSASYALRALARIDLADEYEACCASSMNRGESETYRRACNEEASTLRARMNYNKIVVGNVMAVTPPDPLAYMNPFELGQLLRHSNLEADFIAMRRRGDQGLEDAAAAEQNIYANFRITCEAARREYQQKSEPMRVLLKGVQQTAETYFCSIKPSIETARGTIRDSHKSINVARTISQSGLIRCDEQVLTMLEAQRNSKLDWERSGLSALMNPAYLQKFRRGIMPYKSPILLTQNRGIQYTQYGEIGNLNGLPFGPNGRASQFQVMASGYGRVPGARMPLVSGGLGISGPGIQGAVQARSEVLSLRNGVDNIRRNTISAFSSADAIRKGVAKTSSALNSAANSLSVPGLKEGRAALSQKISSAVKAVDGVRFARSSSGTSLFASNESTSSDTSKVSTSTSSSIFANNDSKVSSLDNIAKQNSMQRIVNKAAVDSLINQVNVLIAEGEKARQKIAKYMVEYDMLFINAMKDFPKLKVEEQDDRASEVRKQAKEILKKIGTESMAYDAVGPMLARKETEIERVQTFGVKGQTPRNVETNAGSALFGEKYPKGLFVPIDRVSSVSDRIWLLLPGLIDKILQPAYALQINEKEERLWAAEWQRFVSEVFSFEKTLAEEEKQKKAELNKLWTSIESDESLNSLLPIHTEALAEVDDYLFSVDSEISELMAAEKEGHIVGRQRPEFMKTFLETQKQSQVSKGLVKQIEKAEFMNMPQNPQEDLDLWSARLKSALIH